jgi:hypothetical protein
MARVSWRRASLIEPVSANSNRVSGLAFWKLQFRDQRLARKMPLRSPDNEKLGSQRLAASPLSDGNSATIFSAGTWLTETALPGWGERTRTCKCHFEKCPLKCRTNFP